MGLLYPFAVRNCIKFRTALCMKVLSFTGLGSTGKSPFTPLCLRLIDEGRLVASEVEALLREFLLKDGLELLRDVGNAIDFLLGPVGFCTTRGGPIMDGLWLLERNVFASRVRRGVLAAILSC